jgi:hypothetical protein
MKMLKLTAEEARRILAEGEDANRRKGLDGD